MNESERKRIYRDIYPREFKLLENTFTSCQTGTRKTIRNREHGSVPRDNGVNLGSHDNRASTRITYFKDSHPLAKDGSAILVS